jgi:hypothetical protein
MTCRGNPRFDNISHVTSRPFKTFCPKKVFQSEIPNSQQIQMFCNFGRPPWVSGTCGSLYLREWVQNMMLVVYSGKYKSGKIQFWGELINFAPETLQLFAKFRSAQQGEHTEKCHYCAGIRKNVVSICKFYWEKQRSRDYSENRSVIYRVIHKSLRNFQTPLRNNQDRHSRKEHINK